MNYLLESRRNLIDISACKQSELYSFSKGNKGYAFGNGIMSYADGTGRDHLRPKAPPGGPLAQWHKPPLALEVKIDRYLTASRGPDASAKTCEKLRFSAFGSDRNAHIHVARM